MADFKSYDFAYKMDAYAYLTSAIIGESLGVWTVSTPEDTTTFQTDGELDDYVVENLEAMEELVEDGQIERELWDAAWSYADSEAYARELELF